MDGSDLPQVSSVELRKKRIQSGAAQIFKYLFEGRPSDQVFDAHVLTLGGSLTELERASLIELLLWTFPPDQAEELCRSWFKDAGHPSAQLMDDPREDAKFWASGATSREVSAYAAACFNRMSPKRKGEFVKWAEGKANA